MDQQATGRAGSDPGTTFSSGRLSGYQEVTSFMKGTAQGCRCQKPHGPQAKKHEGIKDLCPAQSDRGAGERPDQGMPGSAAFSSKGAGEGEWRVAPDRCHAQPAEVIQVQSITAAGAGGGDGMRAATLAN